MSERLSVAIPAGEPAGIGPELCAMIAARHQREPYGARLVFLGDFDVLTARAARIDLAPHYVPYDAASFGPAASVVEVWHQPVAAPVTPGRPDPTNAHSVLTMLRDAADACSTGAFAALVTAPVQKSVLLDAGIPFSGHTEFFAQRTRTPRVVMMLVGGDEGEPLRVALVTTHIALRDVPAAISRTAVHETIVMVANELTAHFGIPSPKVAVCGLNPHSGEGGHLGREDVEIIAPTIAACRERGMDVTGPIPADTVFVPDHARAFDAIIAMYHDQGLGPFKAVTFGQGVNVTLGLPFVRTSVDHGTALDLARDARRARTADPGSLHAAVQLALDLARQEARQSMRLA